MINTSAEYKKYIAGTSDEERNFQARATIKLKDDTSLDITEKDILVKGFKINDATSANNSFQIGAAIINQCSLMLNNVEGKFDEYDFTDAEVRPYVGLKLSKTTEWLSKGVYTVDDPKVANSILTLICLDNMYKFDRPFSEVEIDFPCTNLQLLQAVCLHCGVLLSTLRFLNYDFVIERRPGDKAINCREIVSWIAQMAGCFAKINTQGNLALKWYDFEVFENESYVDGGDFDEATPYATGDNVDGGDFADYTSGDDIDGGTFLDAKRFHHLYALSQIGIGTDDVVITGIQIKAMGTKEDYGETVTYGTEGYMIRIDDNPLIQENTAGIIANSLGPAMVGMRFRPLDVTILSDPSIEAGDVAKVSDRKGNVYHALITNVTFTIGENEKISCDAETPGRKRSTRYDAYTKAVIESRRVAQQEINAYDLAAQQLNDLVLHSFGVYKTEETLEDGSKILYSHDKPTLEESQNIWKQTANTFTVSNDGGVTWRGMDADGNMVVTVLNALGINAEWINVGTLKGIRIEADTGRIGPYNISTNGLTSNTMQFFDNGSYPLIWMEKPGFSSGVNGSAKANYEPSIALVRSIEDGIETDVAIIARDDTTGKKGKLAINRIDLSSNLYVSTVELHENGLRFEKYSGGSLESIFDITDNAIIMYKDGKSLNFILDTDSGDSYINSSGKLYINGMDLGSIKEDLVAIKDKLGMS